MVESRYFVVAIVVFVALGAVVRFSALWPSKPPPLMAEVRISGTSGRLFKGEQIRSFPTEELRFQNEMDDIAVEERETGVNGELYDCAHWGVVTTIFEPSTSMRVVASMPGYCLVIVADRKTPHPFALSGPNIRVLTVADQERLAEADEFIASTPWNHFGRKNIGFLYAIVQGATLIFDFDDDNEPRVVWDASARANISKVHMPAKARMLHKPEGCDAINVYPGMGATSLPAWPRGYPLSAIKKAGCDLQVNYAKTTQAMPPAKVVVFQSLASNDPDVDAIYRLTQPLPLDFSHVAEAVILPKNLYSPYNAQATLHSYKAFFGLYLPVTVHGRVSDIWRSYITQRLLWDADLLMGFANPMVVQTRNPHNYLGDLDAENDLYMRTEVLLKFLNNWRSTAGTMAGRMEELYVALYEHDYIQLQDVRMVQHWLSRLQHIGYSFPEIIE